MGSDINNLPKPACIAAAPWWNPSVAYRLANYLAVSVAGRKNRTTVDDNCSPGWWRPEVYVGPEAYLPYVVYDDCRKPWASFQRRKVDFESIGDSTHARGSSITRPGLQETGQTVSRQDLWQWLVDGPSTVVKGLTQHLSVL